MHEETAEVSGPPDAAYLSNVATFRLARKNAEEVQSRRFSSSMGSEDTTSPAAGRQQPPRISSAQDQQTAQAGTDPSIPSPAPGLMDMTAALDQSDVHPSELPDISPAVTTPMVDSAVSTMSTAEYVRAATEMSHYITEDLTESSGWSVFSAGLVPWNA